MRQDPLLALLLPGKLGHHCFVYFLIWYERICRVAKLNNPKHASRLLAIICSPAFH